MTWCMYSFITHKNKHRASAPFNLIVIVNISSTQETFIIAAISFQFILCMATYEFPNKSSKIKTLEFLAIKHVAWYMTESKAQLQAKTLMRVAFFSVEHTIP